MTQRLKEGRQILFGLLLYFGFQMMSSAAEVSGAFEATPDWVKPVPAFQTASTHIDSDYGLHEHLSDVQINALDQGDTHIYNATEFSLTNEFGVENFSTLDIAFDPAYQAVTLHELLVNRGGQTMRESEENPELFNFFFQSFQWLDQTPHSIGNFHLQFMLELSSFLGFIPGGDCSAETPYFDLQEGVFLPKAGGHPYFLDESLSPLFYQLLQANLQNCHEVKISREDRRLLLQNTLDYYRLHLENFPEIHAHLILQEIF